MNTPTELKKLAVTFTWQWKGPVTAKLPDVGPYYKATGTEAWWTGQGQRDSAAHSPQPTARRLAHRLLFIQPMS